jgi:hypothetical protein
LAALEASGGLRLIKTVWAVTLCVAGLGGSYAGKVAASIPPSEETITASTKVSTNFAQDTLTQTDKFNVPHHLREQTLPTEPGEAASGQLQDANKSNPNSNRVAVMLPKPRSKIRLSETSIR